MESESVDLETVLLPFFRATNTLKITNIPQDALDKPLEPAYDRDGSVKFSRNGKPVIKVNKNLSDNIKLVRDNFRKSDTNLELKQYIQSLTAKMNHAIETSDTNSEFIQSIQFLVQPRSEKRPHLFLPGDYERGKRQ